MEWWNTFICQMEESLEVTTTAIIWPFAELLEVIQEAVAANNQVALTEQPSLPAELLKLRLAEVDSLDCGLNNGPKLTETIFLLQ